MADTSKTGRGRAALNRRSFMDRILGGAALAGGALTVIVGPAHAQVYTGRTDSDPSDQAGYGRGGTGVTDSDPTDQSNYGRGGGGSSGGGGYTGVTDSDPNDAANYGRGSGGSGGGSSGGGYTGVTDSDPSDQANYGRGSGGGSSGRGYTGVTDSDPTDQANYGRGSGGGSSGGGYTGVTDSDPSDQANYGRGSGGRSAVGGGNSTYGASGGASGSLNGEWLGDTSSNRVAMTMRPGGIDVRRVTQHGGQAEQPMFFRETGQGEYRFDFGGGNQAIVRVLGPGVLRITNPDGWTDVFRRVG